VDTRRTLANTGEARVRSSAALAGAETRHVADLGSHRDPRLLRRYFEAYALNTAGITDHRSIYEAAGIARATGDTYEQLLRIL
jgi:hypothetical protein